MRAEYPARRMLIVTAAALVGGALSSATGAATAANVAWIAAAVIPLGRLLRQIVADLVARRPGVDIIAGLAVAAALALGEVLTAAVIGLMLATGDFLEEYAAGRAERELGALVERAPRLAHRLSNGEAHTVAVGEVVLGDRLLVKPGEVIPVDGIVVGDPALVDESAITGEPLPVERTPGDIVASGALNAAGPFEIRATATAEASTYAGIVRLVEEARASRSPSVRLADRWAAWFIPMTLAVAGGAWVASGDSTRALAVLVVATPCPLLLAVPVAIVSGISRAARRGVVFRGGGALETLARVENLLIDKTGTVTLGEPTLHDAVSFDPRYSGDDVLRLAASIDQASTHVLARAIVGAARERGLPLAMATGVSEKPGSGIVGRLDGRRVGVGSAPWLLEGKAMPSDVAEYRHRLLRVAPMTVFVAVDGAIAGALVFDDVIRPDATATLRALRRAGVRRIVMATGDHPTVAHSVGMAIDVDEVLAECTPADKVDAVHDLRKRGVTAMVGDGINDAPALAAADVGVAMGARGATASSEAAPVVLMVDRLDGLVDAISIAKRSRLVALQSVVLGMGLSGIAMGFAAAGAIAPIVGAVVQEAIDVASIVNALRALTGKVSARRKATLPPELSARLRSEHEVLRPRLDMLQATADRLDVWSRQEAKAGLQRVAEFLTDEVLPHESADDRDVYPQVAALLGGEDPLASMSRTHREIFRLISLYQRTLGELPPDGPDEADLRDLRRLLYGLHAILRLHFAQEEELYTALHDEAPKSEERARTHLPESDRTVS
ncbi:MAG TPA: heavy metal translocating P-type ATPase [Acidimicrobiia bacterium]